MQVGVRGRINEHLVAGNIAGGRGHVVGQLYKVPQVWVQRTPRFVGQHGHHAHIQFILRVEAPLVTARVWDGFFVYVCVNHKCSGRGRVRASPATATLSVRLRSSCKLRARSLRSCSVGTPTCAPVRRRVWRARALWTA